MRHQSLQQYIFYVLCLFAASILVPPIFSQFQHHAATAIFYESGTGTANINSTNTICRNRSEWMRDATWLHNRSLYEITLPGTHDSGAYMLYNDYLRGFVSDWIEDAMELAQLLHIDMYHIVKMWALSQATSVAGQLRAGAL